MSDIPGLPTEEELKGLSLRAMVVYAARCARRVQNLFVCDKPAHRRAVDGAIRVAERFAAGRRSTEAFAAAAGARDAAAYAAREAAALAAARAALYAASAVEAADDALHAAHYAHAAAISAYAAARVAGRAAADRAGADALWASRQDFRQLFSLTTEPSPALGAAIDLEALGPLWPEAEPDWLTHARERKASYGPDMSVLDAIKLGLWDFEAPEAPGGEASPSQVPSESGRSEEDLAQMVPDVVRGVLVVAYDPTIVSEEDYARLVTALGDLVRAEGGVGVKRVQSRGFGVPMGEGVLR